jgi:hypothetical protein
MSTGPPRPGRRAAVRRGPRSDLTLAAAVMVVVLAALAVLATRAGPPGGTVSRPVSGAPVTHTLLGCPRGQGDSTLLRLTAAPLPDLGSGGSVRQGEPGTDLRPVRVERGAPVSLTPSRPSRVVDADGDLAAGLAGVRSDRTGTASAQAACVPPSADWWFTGAGASLDHTAELVLVNVDPGPAVVDVRLLGPDGDIDAVGTRGVTIGPGEERRLPLTDVAPTAAELAVGVHATRGRVVAFTSDAFASRAGRPPGLDWLPATVRPSRTLRLDGLPPADRRTLVVGNPSDLEALVTVEVAGAAGSFAPTGVDRLAVAPGTVQTVDLTKAVDTDEPVALRLRSRVPVVATVRSQVPGDTAYAASATPLDGPAAAPAGPASTVVLTAGALGGRAAVTAYDGRGTAVGDTELTLPPLATAAWSPPKRAAYVVVRPAAEAGAVHGAVTSTERGLAVFPLTSLAVRVEEPAVRPALR